MSIQTEIVYILRDRFPLDGVLTAVAADASGTGLCKLCRVRFRLSIFGESVEEDALVASLATVSTADILVLREGTAAASTDSLSEALSPAAPVTSFVTPCTLR